MEVGKFSVVTIRYTLSNKDGEVLDQSDDQELLTYMHGTEYLVPGLENAITGHKVGDKFNVEVKAEDGYGPYHDTLVKEIPLNMFGGAEIHVNDSFLAETEEGQRPVIIRAINGDKVVVDGNHPLAGVDLYFAVEIVDIREPTAEEKDHGHVHLHGHCESEHGCCHHHEEGEHKCCHHHHDDEEEGEHKCCHHHHDDEEDGEHKCCHHHHDDEEDGEHKCCHHHHDDEEEGEHKCCHHHHDDE